MPYRLGVDVGGTFTDLMLFHEETERYWRLKTPSTPRDPSQAVLSGVERICGKAGVDQQDIAYIMHGTTVTTNCILEGKGARVGLVTTEGFREILHLARSQTPGPLAGWIIMIKPDPPALLSDTVEVSERMTPHGEVVRELDEEAAEKAIRKVVDGGIEALTISLLNSFANPAHEQRLKEIAHKVAPDLPITISYEVLPEIREYERTLTATMNSYVRPITERYLDNLERELKKQGVKGNVNILRSDAGLMTVDTAKQIPVNAAMSGPAGGVAGALDIAKKAGYPNIITFDMGGTSTDVALCRGEPEIGRETELGYFPIKIASVDVRSVGAGGGSIAHVPEITKALRVGPESAGADPGPASYGKGGDRPAVTDANVVCGYLPAKLIGGEMTLDVEKARTSVQTIADALGIDLYDAAEGILKIVNENMFGACRLVSVQKGFDPREFALMAFGGAGPLHGNAVAELLGSWPVIVPPAPGILCAMGDLSADYRGEFARSYIKTEDQLDPGEILAQLEELGKKAVDMLDAENIAKDRQEVAYTADLRYYLQGYEMTIPVDLKSIGTEAGVKKLVEDFHKIHERQYGFRLDNVAEVVTVRAVGIGKVKKIALPEQEPGGADPSAAFTGDTKIYRDGKWHDAKLYDRGKLVPGHVVPGPAIVTEMDSTTVIHAGYQATVDRFFNLLIDRA